MKRLFSFSNWKLRWKFLFIFVALIILPMLAFSLFIYGQLNDAVQRQAIEDTKGHLGRIEESLMSVKQNTEDISSYMIYSEEFRSFLVTPNVPKNLTKINEMTERINGYSIFHLNSKPYLHSITLEGMYNNRVHIGTPLQENNESSWRFQAIVANGKTIWSDAYPVKDYWSRENKVISLYRVIRDINNITRPIGLVTIRMDAAKLYQTIDSDATSIEHLVVLNRDGAVLMHPNSSYIGETYPNEAVLAAIDSDITKQEVSYQEDHIKYSAIVHPVADTKLVLLAIVNKESVAQGITGIRDLMQSMIIVLTVLGVLAMIGFYHYHIKRIIILMKQTKQVEKGDFSAKVSVTSKDEIGLLGERFNTMVDRLKNLIDKEYKAKIREQESQLRVMQNQINPHFLYNTLDMIRWTSRLENAMETSNLIEQLSKMFRISLSKGNSWVSLKDELTYSKIYLDLQKRRLGKHFQYTIFCDHEALGITVLKQIIQPLIENSIQHGLPHKKKDKKIYIRCFIENQELIIDVIDNGKGFSEEKSFTDAMEKGFALRNIQERIKLGFGVQASIYVEQNHSPGAWIRIKLPCDRRQFNSQKSTIDEGESNDN